MDEGLLTCDICGEAIPPDEFTGMDRLAPNTVVVVQRGVVVGDIIDCDIWAHAGCVEAKGVQIGEIEIGRG